MGGLIKDSCKPDNLDIWFVLFLILCWVSAMGVGSCSARSDIRDIRDTLKGISESLGSPAEDQPK